MCATIGHVRIVVDSSTLISLAWAGQLPLLGCAPVALVIPAEVRREVVDEGLARGYPDAAAIESTVKVIADAGRSEELRDLPVDDAVLVRAREHGVLLTNDLALGRRALNTGVRWLRTADFIVLCVRSGGLDRLRGVAAVKALRAAGRITEELLDAYLEELP